MCELFAMSSRVPAIVNYSLHEFAKHGGLTYSNRSGWGIASFQEREVYLVKEPKPASDSPWVAFIAEQNIESTCVIAHVRHATVGMPALHNTHPFRRALGGRVHVFAHNGTLKAIHEMYSVADLAHQPIGDTDSELAYCLLLERLERLWRPLGTVPPVEKRLEVFTEFSAEMRPFDSSNFLYADGDALFVHAHRRIYEEGARFSAPRPPGLSMRNCVACQQGPEWACDGLRVGLQDQRTILFASVPLDEWGWEPLPEGTTIAVQRGEERARMAT